MEQEPESEFIKLMRTKTRQIHSISDTLVQSKFVIGLIDDKVWAEGLLVFYEVFRYLEHCMERLLDENVGRFYIPELLRTNYFEADLDMYYGPHWKDLIPQRQCVREYISHLEHLERTDSDLLIAYIYHLYLGLLSGGRILRAKQKLISSSQFANRQSSVVDFDKQTVRVLKKFIKDTTNNIVEHMDEAKKNKILEESITVFKLNCDLIRSVNSANLVVGRIIKSVTVASLVVFCMIMFYCYSGGRDDEKSDEL